MTLHALPSPASSISILRNAVLHASSGARHDVPSLGRSRSGWTTCLSKERNTSSVLIAAVCWSCVAL
eukprot:4165108-Pleurochrysis_carterae.AAC.1